MNLNRLKSLAACIVLAGAGLGVASNANACSVAAWTDTNKTATDANAGSPPTVRRYYGLCGLNANAPGIVVGDNSPAGATETTYRARFYFFPNVTSGSAKILSINAGENGTGTELVGLTFTSAGALQVAVNGGATTQTINGLTNARWYGVEVTYIANTSVQVDVRGNKTFTGTTTIAAGVPSTGVDSVTLGFITGAGTQGGAAIQFDEFESSRAGTAIGFLPRGNARIESGTQSYTLLDVLDVLTEFRTGTLAQGNPDAEEDGDVDLLDVLAVLTRFRTGNFPP
jgi:hypothetical protein